MSEKNPIPSVLLEFTKPVVVDPLEQYKALFEGLPPENLASLEQWDAFQPLLQEPYNKKTGVFLPELKVFSLYNSPVFQVEGVPREELEASNFPKDKKIYLHVNKTGSGAQTALCVAALIRAFFKNPDRVVADLLSL